MEVVLVDILILWVICGAFGCMLLNLWCYYVLCVGNFVIDVYDILLLITMVAGGFVSLLLTIVFMIVSSTIILPRSSSSSTFHFVMEYVRSLNVELFRFKK